MKKIIQLVILFLAIFMSISAIAQDDTIKINIKIPDFENGAVTNTNRNNDDNNSSKNCYNKFSFLNDAIYLIKVNDDIFLSICINNMLWTTSNIVNTINKLESPIVKFKNINRNNSFSSKVAIYSKNNFDIALIKGLKIEKSLISENDRIPDSGTLVLYYIYDNEDAYKDSIKCISMKVDLKWKKDKASITNFIISKKWKILGGFIVNKYQINNANDLNIVSPKTRVSKKRSKEKESTNIFPLGVFQYKVIGLLIKNNKDYFIQKIPININNFKTKQDSESDEIKQKDKDKKKKHRGRTGRRGRRHR